MFIRKLDAPGATLNSTLDPGDEGIAAGLPVPDALREVVRGVLEDHYGVGHGASDEDGGGLG